MDLRGCFVAESDMRRFISLQLLRCVCPINMKTNLPVCIKTRDRETTLSKGNKKSTTIVKTIVVLRRRPRNSVMPQSVLKVTVDRYYL